MARSASKIMSAGDKRAALAELRREIKEAKTENRKDKMTITAINKDLRAATSIFNKSAKVIDKLVKKLPTAA